MKPTEKNIMVLKAMGFKPETEDLTGWWRLNDGWSFVLDKVPSIKKLVETLMETEYDRGAEDEVYSSNNIRNSIEKIESEFNAKLQKISKKIENR